MPVHTVLLLIFILKDPVNNINLRLRFRIVEQYSLVSSHCSLHQSEDSLKEISFWQMAVVPIVTNSMLLFVTFEILEVCLLSSNFDY